MNDLIRRVNLHLFEIFKELSSAIAEGEHRCASGAVMEHVREALLHAGWAGCVVQEMTILMNSPLFHATVEQAIRLGRDD